MKTREIGVWVDGDDFAERLGALLEPKRSVRRLRHLSEVLDFLDREDADALVIGSTQLAESGEDFTCAAYSRRRDFPVVLAGPSVSANAFWLLQMYGLCGAINPSLSVSARHLDVFFTHLSDPDPLHGLGAYFPPDCRRESRRVGNLEMRRKVYEEMEVAFAGLDYVPPRDLQLIYEEILNNAMFHAFDDSPNLPRRSAERLHRSLEDDQQVQVEWACDNAFCAFAVTDNKGLLSRQDVWDRFFRQTSMTGLLDTDGRGLYLTHLLSRQVTVTIMPGCRTEIIVFFCHEPGDQDKLISVRMLESMHRGAPGEKA